MGGQTRWHTPDLFWQKVDCSKGKDGCWNWLGASDGRGYGQIRVHKRLIRAHRYAFELTHGPISRGEWVLHTCDNPSCVNPAHLKRGDHAANMRDMSERGRAHKHQPECNSGHPFTIENTRWYVHSKTGKLVRACRTCGANRSRKHLHHRRQVAQAD